MLSDNDSSDDEPDNRFGLRINKDFAEKFEKKKRLQELQQNKDLLSEDDDDSETSESEDDDAAALSTSLDLEVLYVTFCDMLAEWICRL